MILVRPLSVVAFLLVVGVPLFSEMTYTASSEKQQNGKIIGVILDSNDSRVASALVRIESGKIKRKLKSGDAGQFEISLPEGSYQITVEANGFRRFVCLLEVRFNETEMINIHLEVASSRVLLPASSIGKLAERLQ